MATQRRRPITLPELSTSELSAPKRPDDAVPVQPRTAHAPAPARGTFPSTGKRKPITLPAIPTQGAGPQAAEVELQLQNLSDSVTSAHAHKGPSFRDAQTVELAARPPPRYRPAVQVVNWQQEKESLNLLLKTDTGVWFLAKVISALLVLRIFIGLLGAKQDTSFAMFLHTMTQPLVTPFETLTGSYTITQTALFETPAAIALLSYFILCTLISFGVRTIQKSSG